MADRQRCTEGESREQETSSFAKATEDKERF